uniref:Uncharacterized protein n=1 Tax=Ditylenchus dipsaci TaxID=166011 RepID=A0A915D646_9BILA
MTLNLPLITRNVLVMGSPKFLNKAWKIILSATPTSGVVCLKQILACAARETVVLLPMTRCCRTLGEFARSFLPRWKMGTLVLLLW